LLLSRHHRQRASEGEAKRAAWDPAAILFDEQYACFTDTCQLQIYDCTRRSGKSRLAAVLLLDTALKKRRAKCLFLALTREDARDLVWQWLLEYNEDYALGGVPNEVRLEMRFPNGSAIRLGGAKDQKQAGRWRGRGYDLIIIDECQTFPSHIRDLVESILLPTMLKEGGHGRMILMGTPGEVPGVGYWEEVVAKAAVFGSADWQDRVNAGAWSKHKWSLYQNPHLGTREEVEAFLDLMAETMGGRQASRFQREFLGLRPPPDALDRPYQYDPRVNDPETLGFGFALLPESYTKRTATRWEIWNRWALPLGGKWTFTFGIDIGSRAASAIAVLGTTDAMPGVVWLIAEWLGTRPGIDKLREKVEELRGVFGPKIMAVDEGALGDMIADQWRAPPYLLPVSAAEKLHERVHADFVSGAMAQGRLRLAKSSRLAEDMAVLRWDEKKLVDGKRKIALVPHSDIEPATRYAFKDAFAVAQAIHPPPPKPSNDGEKERAELEKERREGEKRRRQAEGGRLAMGGKASAWRR
jgi:hypothetical protein